MSINPNQLPGMSGEEKDRFLSLRADGYSVHEARVAAFREKRILAAHNAGTLQDLKDIVLSMLEHGV